MRRPEYGFGFGLEDPASALKGEKVLLIKTAWGGKTLASDFRPVQPPLRASLFAARTLNATLQSRVTLSLR